jgi:hypothetical protein
MAGIAAVNTLIIIITRIFIPCGPAATVAMRVTSGNFLLGKFVGSSFVPFLCPSYVA